MMGAAPPPRPAFEPGGRDGFASGAIPLSTGRPARPGGRVDTLPYRLHGPRHIRPRRRRQHRWTPNAQRS
ncbi:hypothetical protein BDI4_10211 [Burkholderia diffusa]|nr:hypothetical protein BDI4_10211 [Burkholderia diffusa]